jgi:hypothetical protein
MLRIFALTLALTFVTVVGVGSFASPAHAASPCCGKRGR